MSFTLTLLHIHEQTRDVRSKGGAPEREHFPLSFDFCSAVNKKNLTRCHLGYRTGLDNFEDSYSVILNWGHVLL